MNHLSSELTGRMRASIKQWFQKRLQECVRCCHCDGTVTPWDSHCPVCGQKDPVRVSKSAVVYLLFGFVLLAAVLSAFIWAF
jgi:hypothetical protein